MLEFEIAGSSVTSHFPATRLVVMGVGGAGNNTINALVDAGKCDYTCISVNTDAQALDMSRADQRIRIGTTTTKGRGAGADPLLGRAAAEENIQQVIAQVKDADLVFLVGGLGGGTGSGALPIIAQALREHNILTVCLVTKPFAFEGKRRMLIAEQAVELLKDNVDTLITIPNEKLFQCNEQSALSFIEACGMINGIIHDYVRSITDIISKSGHINVDFADVKTVIKGQGHALMGTARAEGSDRAVQAAHAALTSPFAETNSIRRARNILINITANHTLSLQEVQQAVSRIAEDCDEHANIIFGSVIDEAMGSMLAITVIATGFDHHAVTPTAQTSDSRYLYVSSRASSPADTKLKSTMQQQHTASPTLSSKEPAIVITKDHPLREVMPSLEKRFREQTQPSLEELETPAFLRKLAKESNTN